MPDPVTIVAMLLIAALVESSGRPLVPIGALLAVGLLIGDGATLGPIALLGAAGVTLAHLGMALNARRGRDRVSASPAAQAQREAMRARLASSGAFARITFGMAALPGPMAKLIYPLLGSMRAPLMPALAGSFIGRSFLYIITTSLFVWIARLFDDTDDQGAATFLLVTLALFTLFRLFTWIDWAHRGATGEWRLREARTGLDPRAFGGMTMGGTAAGSAPHAPSSVGGPGFGSDEDDPDIVEGDVVGEEIVEDEDGSDDAGSSTPAGELPRGS